MSNKTVQEHVYDFICEAKDSGGATIDWLVGKANGVLQDGTDKRRSVRDACRRLKSKGLIEETDGHYFPVEGATAASCEPGADFSITTKRLNGDVEDVSVEYGTTNGELMAELAAEGKNGWVSTRFGALNPSDPVVEGDIWAEVKNKLSHS